jgi:hypothetical protein
MINQQHIYIFISHVTQIKNYYKKQIYLEKIYIKSLSIRILKKLHLFFIVLDTKTHKRKEKNFNDRKNIIYKDIKRGKHKKGKKRFFSYSIFFA